MGVFTRCGTVGLATALALACSTAIASEPEPTAPTPEQQAAFEACSELPDGQLIDCLAASGTPMIAADGELTAAMDIWNESLDAAVLAHAHALAARGDAHDLLLAAMLAGWIHSGDNGDPSVHPLANEWFTAARRLDPVDPLVAWIEATNCPGLAVDCEASAGLARLLQADADNAAAHWLAMHAAHRAGDRVAMRTHLRLAARAPRTDLYHRQLLRLLDQARRSIRLPPLDAKTAAAFGTVFGLDRPATGEDMLIPRVLAGWLAVAMPALAGFAGACSDNLQMGNDPALRQDCIAVLARLIDDESMMLTSLFALPLLIQLTAAQVDGERWREQLRATAWLLEKAGPLMPGLPGSGVSPGEYFGWWAAEGELAALRRTLSRNGVPTVPPPGWLPGRARYRALVAGGHTPDPR